MEALAENDYILQKKSEVQQFLSNLILGGGKWYWIRHTSFWLFMYFDEVLYTIISEEGFLDLDYVFIPFLFDVVIVYFNLFYLIPRFFKRKKHLSYSVYSALSVVVNVALMMTYFSIQENELPYTEDVVSSIISTMTLLATAVAIKIGKIFFIQQQETEQLRLEQSQLELNYLRQQVNPHFLFNVLNTIHIQSKTKPQNVSETVLQLSDILRYQIYDAGKSKTVTLDKEIEFLKNYASLEKTRRDNLELNWNSPSSIPRLKITPFLFLPLVENAFKHSRTSRESKSVVTISWEIKQHNISLEVSNTVGDVKNDIEGGFGIDNLKKRLNLLYPRKHNLELSLNNNTFLSRLEINQDEVNNN